MIELFSSEQLSQHSDCDAKYLGRKIANMYLDVLMPNTKSKDQI